MPEVPSASRLLAAESGREASRSVNVLEAKAGDRALAVDCVGVVDPLTGSVVLFATAVGFNLVSPFPPVEVPLLPLRVLFMYSAMASASRSRIRDATGDMAKGTPGAPLLNELEPLDDGLGRIGMLPLDDDAVGWEDPGDFEGGTGPFGGGMGGDCSDDLDPSASEAVVRLPDDPLLRRFSSSFVSLIPFRGSSPGYTSRAARSPARAAA